MIRSIGEGKKTSSPNGHLISLAVDNKGIRGGAKRDLDHPASLETQDRHTAPCGSSVETAFRIRGDRLFPQHR